MNYEATPNDHPTDDELRDLIEYVADDLRLQTAAGVPATEDDLEGFRRAGRDQDVSYLHTFSFAENHDPDEIADRVRAATRETRDGEVLVGVHEGVYGNNHAHVAEVGRTEDVAMDVSDIVDYREAVADRFDGEQIGAEA